MKMSYFTDFWKCLPGAFFGDPSAVENSEFWSILKILVLKWLSRTWLGGEKLYKPYSSLVHSWNWRMYGGFARFFVLFQILEMAFQILDSRLWKWSFVRLNTWFPTCLLEWVGCYIIVICTHAHTHTHTCFSRFSTLFQILEMAFQNLAGRGKALQTLQFSCSFLELKNVWRFW